MKVLSLFSGIGGIDLGLEWAGMTVVGQIEIDEYCTKTLEKNFPKAKRWRDITTISINDIRRACGRVDIICGGFPCQDVSSAGKGEGANYGTSSGLWREMWRIARELRPNWLLIENVPALRARGADSIISAMEALNYTCWPVVVSAEQVGASHRRSRVWIVAHANSHAIRIEQRGKEQGERAIKFASHGAQIMADSHGTRFGRQWPSEVPKNKQDEAGDDTHGRRRSRNLGGRELVSRFTARPEDPQYDWEKHRAIESKMGSTVDGIPTGLALKAIGNSVVPQIPYVIGKWIMQQNTLN